MTLLDRNDALLRNGWQRQSIQDEPRLTELASLYADIGYEVHLEPYDPAADPGCSQCMQAYPDRYWIIYIREKRQTW